MNAAELLEAAADTIEEKGWIQGEFRSSDGFCALGALIYNKEERPGSRSPVYQQAVQALQNHLVPGHIGVMMWNDHPSQTQGNVCRTLRACAAALAGDTIPAPVVNRDPGDENDCDPNWEIRETEPILVHG